MDERLLSEAEVAAYLHVSTRTLQRWRQRKIGPPVLWAEGRPRYRKSDVDEWLRRRNEERGY